MQTNKEEKKKNNNKKKKRRKEENPHLGFTINDNPDLLMEVLHRLDGRSLGVAACVCKLWNSVCTTDSVWEALCNRHVGRMDGCHDGGRSALVVAMGGYKRLYTVCIRPVRTRLGNRAGWTRDEIQLSLSLFSIDCYERLNGLGSGSVGPPSSLAFLREPVNVR
ncbi:F-box protein SNE [Acorus calamus]|uniref:F-box protein SNE n=1 Tax=Acorus calamus TaxID=4465 RepID=A0AAV9BZ33_ACOCL|nr:F-box protein SNE [Acorus calamus]